MKIAKLLFVLGLFVSLGAFSAFAGPQAHAASFPDHQQRASSIPSGLLKNNMVHPNSGDDCSQTWTFGPSDSFAQYASCISYDSTAVDGVNAYTNVTFGAQNASFWTSCTVVLEVYDSSQGDSLVGSQSFDCLQDARNNATRVGYTTDRMRDNGADQFYAGVKWYANYHGQAISSDFELWSPVVQ